jgi:hypothetical protein
MGQTHRSRPCRLTGTLARRRPLRGKSAKERRPTPNRCHFDQALGSRCNVKLHLIYPPDPSRMPKVSAISILQLTRCAVVSSVHHHLLQYTVWRSVPAGTRNVGVRGTLFVCVCCLRSTLYNRWTCLHLRICFENRHLLHAYELVWHDAKAIPYIWIQGYIRQRDLDRSGQTFFIR